MSKHSSSRPTRFPAPSRTGQGGHRLVQAALVVGVAVLTVDPLAGISPLAGRGQLSRWGQPAAAATASLLTVNDPSSTLLGELNTVEVNGSGVDKAEQVLLGVLDDLDAARAEELAAQADQGRLTGDAESLALQGPQLESTRDLAILARNRAVGLAEAALSRARVHQDAAGVASAKRREAALTAFTGGERSDPLGSGGLSPGRLRGSYLDQVVADLAARRDVALAARSEADAEEVAGRAEAAVHDDERLRLDGALRANAAALAANQAATQQALGDEQGARVEQQRLTRMHDQAKVGLAEARRTGIVQGADLALVVLDALVRAERFEAIERPGCQLSWTLLAAISRVESKHGTYGGWPVSALGQTRDIFGPQLAPGSGFAVIADTDSGLLDGDTVYDRAVGPMQFIPSSWRLYAIDGNGDDVLDPANYYDAALAAAEHLCRGGADTSSASGAKAAVLGYNASEEYYAQVNTLMGRYRRLALAVDQPPP